MYGERLRHLDLFSFQGRLLRSDLILVWKIVHGLCAVESGSFFTFLPHSTTRGHPYKLFKHRANLEVRIRFFSLRIVDEWNAFSAETVTATSLETFKHLLHRDLGEKLFEFNR